MRDEADRIIYITGTRQSYLSMLGGSTTHHCPLKSKGGCRYNKNFGYCTKHQTLCTTHEVIHLQGELCYSCQRYKSEQEVTEAASDYPTSESYEIDTFEDQNDCPRTSQCKFDQNKGYCTEHQTKCPVHGSIYPLADEICPSCHEMYYQPYQQ
ncbi:hypothetical protein BJX99DRAFT_158319 [Aspergillus californicus]